MGAIIDGKQIAADLQRQLKEDISKTFPSSQRPGLSTILVGEDPASQVYVRNKHKTCEDIGILSKGIVLPASSSYEDVASAISKLNGDSSIDGILLQLPLPPQLRPRSNELIELIQCGQRRGWVHSGQLLGALMMGQGTLVSCTPKGIIYMLKAVGETWEGKNVVVINRSNEVGKPLVHLLLKENSTVTICHTRTRNIAAHCRASDVIVIAVGKAKFLTADMVSDGSIVIDVGTNRVEGKLVGDADFPALLPKVKFISPVPGGVGPMTIAMLMENTFLAAKERRLKVN